MHAIRLWSEWETGDKAKVLTAKLRSFPEFVRQWAAIKCFESGNDMIEDVL